jgi:hypothetical protein
MEIDSRLEVTLVSEAIGHLLDRLNLRVEPQCIIRPCLLLVSLLKGVSRNDTRMKSNILGRYAFHNTPFGVYFEKMWPRSTL